MYKKEYIYSNNLMGTELDISVISDQDPELDFLVVEALFKRYEDIFSRFNKSSEVSRLNENKELVVSQEFMETLLLSKEVYSFTNGLINPLCTPKYLGYEYSFDELNNHKLEKKDFGDIDFENIFIDEKTRTIKLQENQNLDFGGILKGHIAEIAANYLAKHSGVIVNLGGDIFCRGLELGDQKFQFQLANPLEIDNSLGTITLFNQALTTSSVVKRNWEIAGQKYNHIVDPRSKGSVNNNILSVSIVFDRGMYADALAKVGLILGVEEGLNYYEKNKIPAIFILEDLQILKTASINKYFNL